MPQEIAVSLESVQAAADSRYVYGACCTWHASIHDAARTSPHIVNGASVSLPCCPHCGSVLLEVPSELVWWASVRQHAKSHPGYEEMIRWSQGKCFPDANTLENAYRQAMEE